MAPGAHRFFQGRNIGGDCRPLLHRVLCHFDMKLRAIGMAAVTEGLDRTRRRAGQNGGSRGKLEDFRSMPLEDVNRLRQISQHGIGCAHCGFGDGKNADLGRLGRPDLTPYGFGEKLMPETDTQIGAPHVDDEIADRGLLLAEPRILVLFPYVLRSTHDDHEIELARARKSALPRRVRLCARSGHPAGGSLEKRPDAPRRHAEGQECS